MTIRADILAHLRRKKYRPVTERELAERLKVPLSADFRHLIREMELTGEVVEVKRRRLALPDRVGLFVGKVMILRQGFGFVEYAGHEDVYIHEENLGTALDGDRVVARMIPGRRGKNAGQIVRVLQRAKTEFVGTLRQSRGLLHCVPDEPRMRHELIVPESEAAGAQPGDKVVVALGDWRSHYEPPEATVKKVLGRADDPAVDLQAIIHEFQLRTRFAQACVDEARALPKAVRAADRRGRLDLRKEQIFTIDPETARDFDDAVSIERIPEGWRLGVHIADVSHYVAAGSPMDREATERSTSVYFPRKAIHMLPTALSSGISSLKPDEDRLTKSVLIRFTPKGVLIDAEVRRSVIRSQKRLTYAGAAEILNGGSARPAWLAEKLRQMNELAGELRQRRMVRGAFDLDLPESELVFDEHWAAVGVRPVMRLDSHRLIEEFMLAANEAVARYLYKGQLPGLFRVHDLPAPEKLRQFGRLAKACGHYVGKRLDRRVVQRLLDEVKDRPYGHALHVALLRSLAHAAYSAKRQPHYALASNAYLHFTSPIRRYPDLLVHRILDLHLQGKNVRLPSIHPERSLSELAESCTAAEVRAERAERAYTTLKILRLLADRTAERMEAVITGVADNGLWVEVRDYQAFGKLPASALTDDFYDFQPNRFRATGTARRKTLKVGETISVRVYRVDLAQRSIDFAPWEATEK